MKCALLMISLAALTAASIAIGAAAQETTGDKVTAEWNISKDDGLAAWKRIEAVVTHPRCANCHVSDNIPMWTIDGEGKTRPHGMNIRADESRAGLQIHSQVGASVMLCGTCHVTSSAPNDVPHAPPHVGIKVGWQLAPVKFAWFGKTGAQICAQMRDRELNGNRNGAGLVQHLLDDADRNGFIPWAWNPGAGRSTPPGTFKDHVKDVATWGAAGLPCPGD